MRDFDSFHPRALMLYFLYVILIPMFVRDPILAGISAVTGMTYRIMKFGRPAARNVLYFLLLALLLTTINPLFSHNGVTPLFYLNGNAYTLEALLYGAAASMNFISLVIRQADVRILGVFAEAVAHPYDVAARGAPLYREAQRNERKRRGDGAL